MADDTSTLFGPQFRLLDLPDVVLRILVRTLTGQDLKILRLTSKTLEYYASPSLFRTLILTPHEPHFNHILNVLATYEEGKLAKYVRVLRFDCRYPADVSKLCFWNRTHLHRFHYESYVLKRNIGVAHAHLKFLLSEFGKLFDGLRFPYLEHIVVCGNKVQGQQDIDDDVDYVPNFYAQRFRELTRRTSCPAHAWYLTSDPTKSKFYITCLLLSIWAIKPSLKSFAFEDEQYSSHHNSIGSKEATSLSLPYGHHMADDFIVTLRGMGLLSNSDLEEDIGHHVHHEQVARVEAMLAEVLVR